MRIPLTLTGEFAIGVVYRPNDREGLPRSSFDDVRLNKDFFGLSSRIHLLPMSQSLHSPLPTQGVSRLTEEAGVGAAPGGHVLSGRLRRALGFEAPYVLDRLLSDRVVDTRAQAQEMFSETKKYLVLCELSPDTAIGMYSGLVDAAWHAFVLFTAEYIEYCQRFFGRYVGHAPTIAEPRPSSGSRSRKPVAAAVNADRRGDSRGPVRKKSSFDDFRHRYEAVFQQTLPDIWYDERCISLNRRMIRDDRQGSLSLTRHDGHVELCRPDGSSLVCVNELADAALQFILATGVFYVRELPGGLTDEEKVGLIQALTHCGTLKIAT
ncbi:glycine-rich domain-containing protein [Mycobacterium attenuatum]|uniref:glycine-rich domain-containing protein n=1 Tax=Mycobacterium attenuatum TaxID=2341086 RepID=UPI0010A96384|nr:hypothetical protein [Mycobacterium attenuatum]